MYKSTRFLLLITILNNHQRIVSIPEIQLFLYTKSLYIYLNIFIVLFFLEFVMSFYKIAIIFTVISRITMNEEAKGFISFIFYFLIFLSFSFSVLINAAKRFILIQKKDSRYSRYSIAYTYRIENLERRKFSSNSFAAVSTST